MDKKPDIFKWLHFGKGVGLDGKLEWHLGLMDEKPDARILLTNQELRQLYDIIGVELANSFGDDSEVMRLQKERVSLLLEQDRLRGVIKAGRSALETELKE